MAEAQRLAASTDTTPASVKGGIPPVSGTVRVYGKLVAAIIGLIGIGGVVISVVNAATYQGPTATAPGGNIPVTIWNAAATGTKQTDADIDIAGTISLGSASLNLGNGAGFQNLIYGYVPFSYMHADDRLLKLETEAGGTWTERFGVDKSGNLDLVGEIRSASGSQMWNSQGANGNFRMTQQDGGGRYHMGWNINGSTLSVGTYNTSGDPALWLRWNTDGYTFFTAASGTAGNTISWSPRLNINVNGNIGLNKTSPQYTLDAASDTTWAILSVSDTNTSDDMYTGLRVARNTTEKWFLGINDGDDVFRLRADSSTDVVTVTNVGDMQAMGNIDADGCFGPVFVGRTTASSQGNVGTDGVESGYRRANALCDAAITGSHVCSTAEILESVKCEVPAIVTPGTPWPADSNSDAWIQDGPPGFTAPANDCGGWKSAAPNNLGRRWRFNSTTGGDGALTTCQQYIRFACCK